MHRHCIVVGGGIIGSAIAYELAKRGITDVHVVDPDLEGSLSSTERNAGGVRHLWVQPINVELSRHSIQLFESIRDEIGFRTCGYLWLFANDRAGDGNALYQGAIAQGLDYEQLSPADIRRQAPFLDRLDDVAFALRGKRDGLLNPNSLKQFYREKAKQAGVVFHDRTLVVSVEGGERVRCETAILDDSGEALAYLEKPESWPKPTDRLTADRVFLAGGAWTKLLLERMHVVPLIQPVRRQICLFRAEDFDFTPYGMIVDSSGVYFHPEADNVLAGVVLKDEPSAFRFDYDSDFFEEHIWPHLAVRSSHLERLKWITGWGGAV